MPFELKTKTIIPSSCGTLTKLVRLYLLVLTDSRECDNAKSKLNITHVHQPNLYWASSSWLTARKRKLGEYWRKQTAPQCHKVMKYIAPKGNMQFAYFFKLFMKGLVVACQARFSAIVLMKNNIFYYSKEVRFLFFWCQVVILNK